MRFMDPQIIYDAIKELEARENSRKIFIVSKSAFTNYKEDEWKKMINYLIRQKPHPKELPFSFHQHVKDYQSYYTDLLYSNNLYRYKFDFMGMEPKMVVFIIHSYPVDAFFKYYTCKDFYVIMDILFPYHKPHHSMTKKRMRKHINFYKELHHHNDLFDISKWLLSQETIDRITK